MKLSFKDYCIKYHKEEMISQWDYDTNKQSPGEVPSSSKIPVAWKCEKGHSWTISPAWRTRCKNTDCPYCSRRRASSEYNLAITDPKMLDFWDYDRNKVLPEEVLPRSAVKYWWKCGKGHSWSLGPNEQYRLEGCPYCNGSRVSEDYNLEALFPEIAKEWDYEKNKLYPKEVHPYSGKKVFWVCSFNQSHKWQAVIVNRTKNAQGCPECNKQSKSSFPEQAVFYYMKKFFPDCQNRAMISGFEVDIYIPDFKLGIEYNGVFHEIYNREAFDKKKVEYLRRQGMDILTIRECKNQTRNQNKSQSSEQSILQSKVDYYIQNANHIQNTNHDMSHCHTRNGHLSSQCLKQFSISSQSQCNNEEGSPEGEKQKILETGEITCQVDASYKYMDEVISKIFEYINVKYYMGTNGEINADIDVNRDRHYIRTLLVNGRKENSLASRYPKLAREWHKEANWPITPEMVSFGEGSPYVWKCEYGHVWKATPNKRTNRNQNCPYCSGHRVSNENRLSKVKPGIAKMWDKDRNGKLTPDDVAVNSHLNVSWKCEKGHMWQRSVKEMVRSGRCPYCSGRRFTKENSLAEKYPHLLEQWDWNKNEISPWEISYGNKVEAWWICDKGHSWKARVANRSMLDRGCPYCSKRLATEDENFAIQYPELAKEWNYSRNGKLNPQDVRPRSNKKVWWICPQGHEWECEINNRVMGCKCPKCRSRYVRNGESLIKMYPDVAVRWNYNRNGDLNPSIVSAKSGEKVWWQCPDYPHHEWQRRIAHEVESKRGCPYCAGYRVCKENSLASLYPELVKEWDDWENGTLNAHDVLYKSHKVVGWICEEGHRWKASVVSRTRDKKQCPHCRKESRR